MSKVLFYRDEDYSAIQDNLDMIVEKSIRKQHLILDPTESEYTNIRSLIVDYIIKNDRIVYGGSAYHNIIEHYKKMNNTTDNKIYKDYEYYDIEFYSPNPISDLINICDILHTRDVKYVMGRQAQHEETYTVFANFYQYCDISFMASSIYDKVPTITIDKIRYIDPSFMLVDILRQFNDPLTSYWRLEKTFKRAKLLISNSNLNFAKSNSLVEFKDQTVEMHKLINFFMKEIMTRLKKVVFIGDLCYIIYTNPSKVVDSNNIAKLEFYSRSLKNDLIIIIDIINKYCSENKIINNVNKYFKINKFYKFFQFWDTKIIVYYKDKPLLIMFGNNHRCIPIKSGKIKFGSNDDSITYELNIGSFMVNLNYYLISYHYYRIYEYLEKTYKDLYVRYYNMIINMLDARNKFLSKETKTVVDNTLYEEFIINCLGKTMEFTREYLVKMYSKKKQKKRVRLLFTYDPNESNLFDKKELKNYKHYNSTGLIKKKINL